MHITPINNTQSNINHKASFEIVGDRALMSSEQLNILKDKAKRLGSTSDCIMVGITRITPERPVDVKPIVYALEKIKEVTDTYTKITAACHTFFDIPRPDSFIRGVANVFGSRTERANKSFEIINSYLDDINANLFD